MVSLVFLFFFVHANDRPVVAILTLPTKACRGRGASPPQYFAASYVKWLEAAGARVVPLFYDSSKQVVQQLLQNVNGVLFTGGGAGFTDPGYERTVDAVLAYSKSLYDSKKDTMAVWGTCLGFEAIVRSEGEQNGGRNPLLDGFDSEDLPLPLDFVGKQGDSRIFNATLMGSMAYDIYKDQPVSFNNHQSGVTPSAFSANKYLSGNYNIIATNKDRKSKAFVSMIENRVYPIFSTQFHPEKVSFEWNTRESIPHGGDAIAANMYLVQAFVDFARQSSQSFSSEEVLDSKLIYNFVDDLKYSGKTGSDFEEEYLFNCEQESKLNFKTQKTFLGQ